MTDTTAGEGVLERLCVAMLDGVGCTPWESPVWDNDGTDGASRQGIRDSVGRILKALAAQPSAGAQEVERVGFKAGWAARTRAIDAYLMHDVTPDVDAAWSAYEPQGAPVAADILIDRLQALLDSYAGNTRAYVDVLDFQALINRARIATPAQPDTGDVAALRERVRQDLAEAIELLTERKHGNPARSPAHNARLLLESTFAALSKPNAPGREG